MQPDIFKAAFHKTFQEYGNEAAAPAIQDLETELSAKIWSQLQMGDSYYFIIDHHTLSVSAVSKEVKDVLGYAPSEFDIPLMVSIIHPDDRAWFLQVGHAILDFFSQLPINKLMKYQVRYDVRLRRKNGSFARILYQGKQLEHDAQGKLLKTLGIHTDISYGKQEEDLVLSFIGMEGEPSFWRAASQPIVAEPKDDLTQRERQVLKLLIEGKCSKEIGCLLKISKQTVDTHRKNMLHKKGLSNTGELIGKAIRMGWI